MKKTFLGRGAIIATCAAIFLLGACSQTEFDGRTDTVYSLDAPSVTAKAYPGVNVVSWKPVTGANGYKVTVYEEGTFKENLSTSGNSYSDKNLVNGKNYTYYVEATSATNPGTYANKAVYATNSRGEASVKAIVPPAGTKSLELPAYEDGYDGTNTKTVPENDQWVVKPNNITVEVAEGKVFINFPMKAYLKYTVKYYNNDLSHKIDKGTSAPSEVSDINTNNVLGQTTFDITNAGNYQIAVVASAYNSNYAESDEVIYSELVTIEELTVEKIKETELSIKYVYNGNTSATDAEKIVRIEFPAVTLNGEYIPTDWYTIYRRVKGEYTNTKIDATVKENKVSTDSSNNTGSEDNETKNNGTSDKPKDTIKYYVDDTVPDITKTYVYTIVVTDGKRAKEVGSNELKPTTKQNIKKIEIDKELDDKAKREIKWTVTTSDDIVTKSNDIELSLKYLIVQDDRKDDASVLAQEILDNGFSENLPEPQIKYKNDNIDDGIESKKYEVKISVSTADIKGEYVKVYLLVQAKSKSNAYATTNYMSDGVKVDK